MSGAPGASVLRELLTQDRELPLVVRLLAAPVGIALVAVAATRGVVEGVVALGVVAVGLAIAFEPLLAGLFLVALAPVTAGLARGRFVPVLRPAEALVVASALLLCFVRSRRQVQPWTGLDLLALAYALAGAVLGAFDLALRGEVVTLGEFRTSLAPLQYFLLYRVVVTTVRTAAGTALAVRLLCLASLPVAVLALLQYGRVAGIDQAVLRWTGATVFERQGFEPQLRATSLFPDWHGLAGYLVVVLVVVVALLLAPDRPRPLSLRWLLVVLVVDLLALAATVTFAAFATLAVAVLLLGLVNRRGAAVVLVSTVVVVGLLVTFGESFAERVRQQSGSGSSQAASGAPQTLAYRFEVWRDDFLPALQGNLLTGFGPDLPYGIQWEHTESVYLTLLLRGGLVLLLLWLLLLAAVTWRALAVRAGAEGPSRPLADAVVALTPVVLLGGSIYPYFTNLGQPHALWALWALALSAPAARPAGRPQPLLTPA